MSKPVYWWCVKNVRGKLLSATAYPTRKAVESFAPLIENDVIVRICVEEVPREGEGSRR